MDTREKYVGNQITWIPLFNSIINFFIVSLLLCIVCGGGMYHKILYIEILMHV